MIFFGMSSGASATLTLVAEVGGIPVPLDGSVGVPAGSTVDVKVVQDAPNPTGTGGEMTITIWGSGSSGSATDTTPSPQPYDPATGIHGWDWSFNGGTQFYEPATDFSYVWFSKTGNSSSAVGMNGTPGIGSYMNMIPGYPDSYYESTIEFSIVTYTKEIELIWGGTWDGVDMTGVVGGTIWFTVPEPMTIALLGLGGLFLRRRK